MIKKMDIAKDLSSIFLFDSLSQSELEEIAQFSTVKEITSQEVLFLEKLKAHVFYAVVSGKLKLFKISHDGKEVTLHIQEAGTLLAEAAIFDESTYPANCKAIEDSTLIRISSDGFKEMLIRSPKLSMKIMGLYSKKLRHLTRLIEELSLYNIKERLALYLIKNAIVKDGQTVCNLSITKKELASLLGTIPETLSRTLNYFHEKKLIRIADKGTKIILENPSELKSELFLS